MGPRKLKTKHSSIGPGRALFRPRAKRTGYYARHDETYTWYFFHAETPVFDGLTGRPAGAGGPQIAVDPNLPLMGDNARPHRANLIKEFMDNEDIRRMDWLARPQPNRSCFERYGKGN
ncbi:hypothetical protein TNCV_1819011 [Trichonephila clavipes]|nr:hypothetical protein TNCV_1819011 [Trichonephila clavipes]